MTSSSGNVPLTAARIHEVRLRNDAKFWRQPNVHAVGEGYWKDRTGGWRDIIGIIVYVSEQVPTMTLPVEDRIPDLLDGVPVQIREEVLTPVELMGVAEDEHRPLLSGITIHGVKNVDGVLTPLRPGMLTGVARRTFDNAKVLLTAAHVMARPGDINPTAGDDMYQEAVPRSTLTSDNYETLYNPTAAKKVGELIAFHGRSETRTNNLIDLAVCESEAGVDSWFVIHENPHGEKMIIPGVVEPTIYPQDHDNPMKLTMVGAYSGVGTVIVRAINEERTIDKIRYTGLTVLEPVGDYRILPGNSGGACLVKVGENRYKMCCIVTSGSASGDRGFGFPASTAERLFAVTFGNHPPVANAGDVQHVSPGDLVELNGSATDEDSGDTFTYQWSQVSGRSPVSLTNPNTANPTFTAPQTAPNWESFPFTFRLKVTDSDGGYATDDVVIRVAPTEVIPGPIPPPPSPTPPAPPAPPPPTPELPIVWRPWEDTGTTRGCGPSQEKEQSRTSNRGDIQHRWMSDSRPEVWGSWSGTGRTLGSGQTREAQESRTSNCNNTQTRWVSDPEPEVWGPWRDTGETMTIDAVNWFKERARTSSWGNRETRWVVG